MNDRRQTAEIFIKMHRRMQRTYDIKIRRHRFDNEFTNDDIVKFLKGEGTSIEPSVPYAHHQNGVAERNMRTMRDKAATAIQDLTIGKRNARLLTGNGEVAIRETTMPAMLWSEAVNHSTWMKN